MPPEKDIILKTWEKLDDDVIIKEVATKGKHVNLCIAFLAQRNELSHNEATNYFLQKVSVGKGQGIRIDSNVPERCSVHESSAFHLPAASESPFRVGLFQMSSQYIDWLCPTSQLTLTV